jgi:hypothetical protein
LIQPGLLVQSRLAPLYVLYSETMKVVLGIKS